MLVGRQWDGRAEFSDDASSVAKMRLLEGVGQLLRSKEGADELRLDVPVRHDAEDAAELLVAAFAGLPEP